MSLRVLRKKDEAISSSPPHQIASSSRLIGTPRKDISILSVLLRKIRYYRLSQRYPAIVCGHLRMREDFKTCLFQSTYRQPQQQPVLEHTAAQRHLLNTAFLR